MRFAHCTLHCSCCFSLWRFILQCSIWLLTLLQLLFLNIPSSHVDLNVRSSEGLLLTILDQIARISKAMVLSANHLFCWIITNFPKIKGPWHTRPTLRHWWISGPLMSACGPSFCCVSWYVDPRRLLFLSMLKKSLKGIPLTGCSVKKIKRAKRNRTRKESPFRLSLQCPWFHPFTHRSAPFATFLSATVFFIYSGYRSQSGVKKCWRFIRSPDSSSFPSAIWWCGEVFPLTQAQNAGWPLAVVSAVCSSADNMWQHNHWSAAI